MSYFNNDHLQINNIIIDFEENISKISSINQVLNSIDNIDEFNELKNQLNILFTDIENDTNTLINTLKIVQFNIRKLYDDFSLLQNNYEDIEEKLKMIINDNTLLIHKNKEINKQINAKNKKINEQEEHIKKLIEIIKNNEIIANEINNKKNIKINTAKMNTDKHKNIMKNNETSTENMKKSNNFNYIMKKNNSVNLKKNENNIIENIKDIKEFNTINNDSKKNNEVANINNNKNSSSIDMINNINTGKYIFNDDFGQDEQSNNSSKNDNNNGNNIKNRIDKVEKIISLIYKNNNLYLKLKNKYGEDLENKILNENVNPEFLDKILIDISEFSENKNNKNLYKKEKNNINNKNIGKDDTHKKNKEVNTNFFENDETGSKLTNYFLFNLQRERMIDSQQKKDFIRPKTPKL